MYWLDTKQHQLPHIHARYAGDEGVFAIESTELLDGSLPPRQVRLMQAWLELHREELMAARSLAVKGEPVFQIDPLR